MWHYSVIFNMTQTQEKWKTQRINDFLWYFSILLTTESFTTHSPIHTHTHREPHHISMLTPFKQAHTHTLMEQPLGERFWVQGLAYRLWHVDWMSGGSNLYIIWQTAPPPGHWSAQEQGWWFKKSLNAAGQKITENIGEFYIRLQTPVAPVMWGRILWTVCCGLTPLFFRLSPLGTWLIKILSTVFATVKMKKGEWKTSASEIYVTKPLIVFTFSSRLWLLLV